MQIKSCFHSHQLIEVEAKNGFKLATERKKSITRTEKNHRGRLLEFNSPCYNLRNNFVIFHIFARAQPLSCAIQPSFDTKSEKQKFKYSLYAVREAASSAAGTREKEWN
jgi:hypothetical protein